MVKIRIESDKSLKPESKEKIKTILENSEDLKADLSKAFPIGFTKFDRSTFTLTLGKGSKVISFVDIKAFKPTVLVYPSEEAVIYSTKFDTDY